MTQSDKIVKSEEEIKRYFDAYIRLEKAKIKNLKAKKFRILVENEPKCNLFNYPFYWFKWRIK